MNKDEKLRRLSTGIPGLDEILGGGMLKERAYLVRGGPGTGKTTLCAHFAKAGIDRGEPVVWVTLSEPADRVKESTSALELDLSKVTFVDLTPGPAFFRDQKSYDIFPPEEVESAPLAAKIRDVVEKTKPTRIVVDSVSQLQFLSSTPQNFHKQLLSLLAYLTSNHATVLLTSEASPQAPDDEVQFLVDGVVELEVSANDRHLRVKKWRGSEHSTGWHSYQITRTGLQVFPRLDPQRDPREFPLELISSGIPALDELLQGGISRGTITLISGPSGVGKTTLGLQFMKEAASRGERSVVFHFEEARRTIIGRGERVNIPISQMLEQGSLELKRIEPLQFSADQFAHMVREEVEQRGTKMVMIDSVAGYRLSLRGNDLGASLHALTQYLGNKGVTTLVCAEVEKITGDFQITEVGISYLADNIIFMRYFEAGGQLRKAIGVLKKRLSDFEKSVREIEITRYGIKVGQPLTSFSGILTGTPEFRGSSS